ncbi:hypothetical protein [Legionella resiliens]|uniref:Uncharacterized protein n=1 Tax=Legionella resiliens TaxID=2905958 RepID=A0ABS8WZS4_9GAMM|nr:MULTISPECIES: hypothetical protein [unclassified Legionella]MCE0722845.1 hypothetical protein [Legionella sp. 9fVS26]MCE3531998.1 hypothetical protein [Legionella sp. 8cVS16]
MQQITTVKRGILFLALSLCYSEAGAVSVVKSPHGARALEYKDIKVPDAKKIQINNTGNLYNFKFVLPASYQNLYPTAYIVQDLVDDFYKSGTVRLTVTQDPPSQPLAKTNFYLRYNNHFLTTVLPLEKKSNSFMSVTTSI